MQYYDAHRNMYSLEHRLLIFKNSKVASTSLWLFMARLLGHANVKARQINLPFLQAWEINHHPEVFKVGFVRDPWDRLLSCYLQKKKDNRTSFYQKTGLRLDMSFEEFARAVCAIPDREADQHFRSQYTFMVDHQGKVIADFIGRFEHLEDDFLEMCRQAKLPEEHLSKNNSTKHVHYRSAYSPELAEAVAQRYAIDLELFGYTFAEPLSPAARYRWKAPLSEDLQLRIVRAKNQKLRYGLDALRAAPPLQQPGGIRRIKNFLRRRANAIFNER
ncbi:MAG: sulfotransferase family 2 domain-containing protein [Bacteroidota bacterium]